MGTLAQLETYQWWCHHFSPFRYFTRDANQHSFTVSYLINSFGFSPKSAIEASKSVRFETTEKPDLALSFFEKLGFSKTQIFEVIRKFPNTLLSDADKTIFPKVEFFRSKGASTPDLVTIFTACPRIVHTGLEGRLVPSFNFVREFFRSDDEALASVKHFPQILRSAYVIPNILTLREIVVPEANIGLLIKSSPQIVINNSVKFRKIVEEVRELEFNPSKSHFVLAAIAFGGISKSKRDRKVDAYKSWGWSDNDISGAFKKNPRCLTTSDDKIMAVTDFYVNKLGLDSSVIAYCPKLLSVSLEKRLIPRGAVFQFLSSKGLVKTNSSITTLFLYTEKCFLEKYVHCHEEAPQLLKLYNEKLDLLKLQGNKRRWERNA